MRVRTGLTKGQTPDNTWTFTTSCNRNAPWDVWCVHDVGCCLPRTFALSITVPFRPSKRRRGIVSFFSVGIVYTFASHSNFYVHCRPFERSL